MIKDSVGNLQKCCSQTVIETAYTVRSVLPSREHTRLQTLSPLADSSVNNTLCCRPLQMSTSRCLSSSTLAYCGSVSRTHAAAWSSKSYNRQGSLFRSGLLGSI